MGTVNIDDRSWPILRVRITGKLSVDDVRAVVAELQRAFARPDNFCNVVDLSDCELPPLSIAGEVQSLLDPVRNELRRRVLVAAIVVRSAVVRTALNALLLVVRLPHPTKIVATQQEAEAYCRSVLDPHKHQAAV